MFYNLDLCTPLIFTLFYYKMRRFSEIWRALKYENSCEACLLMLQFLFRNSLPLYTGIFYCLNLNRYLEFLLTFTKISFFKYFCLVKYTTQLRIIKIFSLEILSKISNYIFLVLNQLYWNIYIICFKLPQIKNFPYNSLPLKLFVRILIFIHPIIFP